MNLSINQIQNQPDLESAFEIRRQVFVVEQHVDPAEEYDEFENQCVHFLALFDVIPCGTARIRKTDKGFKLERFAVLKEYRGKGVGAALVQACLGHHWLQIPGTYVYMHAQEHAIGFYRKLGFKTKGERFWECEIPHFTMWLTMS